ncbi:zf-DNL-domain-containing protein [Polyplosphaeria fusca]|uniref:Zf-DNL-domain-containing protein n=1 Tax=Polyplosphaeria fusca TaxID=682080 RepID=A0A9P4QTP6_9PLEO|nr:zf-DNL-domain-containing protein [Polyplosphaeria fusca]
MASSLNLLCRFARSAAPRIARPPPAKLIPATRRLLHAPRTSLPRTAHVLSRLRPTIVTARHESTHSKSTAPPGTTVAPDSRLERDQVPAYEMTFTCTKCSTRSSHRISKQGYHHGTVLITCPGCQNRHLMSDHLKIFSDKPVTLEDIMREKGQLVKRGHLGVENEGDVEFWDDGTTTPRSAIFIPDSTAKSDPEAAEGRLTEPPASEKSNPHGITPRDASVKK